MLSTVSPTGQETITNVSSGSVAVQVAVTGWFRAPAAPAAPDPVTVSVSGTSATISWSGDPSDGGSPISGYTVTSSPDTGSVTVDPGTITATLTNLPNAATDTYTVTATNAVGTAAATGVSALPSGGGGQASTTPAAGVSYKLLEADGRTAMANASVGVFYTPAADLNVPDGTTYNMVELWSGSTNASGAFTAAVPTSTLSPADFGDSGDGTNDAFNADIVASDQAGNIFDEDVVLTVGSTISDVLTTPVGLALDGVSPGDITSTTPITVTETPQSGTQDRDVPLLILSNGYGERVDFNFNPSSSTTRQTKVDVGVSSKIGIVPVTWGAGGVSVDSTTAYASITKVDYHYVNSSHCAADNGYVAIVWGYQNDPPDSKRLWGNCKLVTDLAP